MTRHAGQHCRAGADTANTQDTSKQIAMRERYQLGHRQASVQQHPARIRARFSDQVLAQMGRRQRRLVVCCYTMRRVARKFTQLGQRSRNTRQQCTIWEFRHQPSTEQSISVEYHVKCPFPSSVQRKTHSELIPPARKIEFESCK